MIGGKQDSTIIAVGGFGGRFDHVSDLRGIIQYSLFLVKKY